MGTLEGIKSICAVAGQSNGVALGLKKTLARRGGARLPLAGWGWQGRPREAQWAPPSGASLRSA